MSSPIDCSKVRFAIAAVREAAQLVRRVQQEMVVDALAKDDKSPVTVADFAAQAIIGRRLSETFPEMGFVGEESADALRDAAGRETLEQITHFVQMLEPQATPEEVCDWIDLGAGEPTEEFWTLDPVDGTKGFLRGDQYAVALGFIRDGVVRVGALGCPELADSVRPDKGGQGSLLVARRGNGTWAGPLDVASENQEIDWKRLAASGREAAAEARLLCSVEKAHTDTQGIGLLIKTLGITADPVPMDSQAKYAVLAAGGGDVNLRLISPSHPDYREKIWDQAAGSIVVEEAGGQVTDLAGKPLDFSHGRTLAANRGVLATNGRLHGALLDGLKEIDA
ncbi:MAG TPA: 3'(2'),5'-bisphosphate nucleotidase [Planctomycetaceae bacterium]|nr:3'(2'),5'-bisphosphate nucleotidase [Planctomycetaceae bacterium]